MGILDFLWCWQLQKIYSRRPYPHLLNYRYKTLIRKFSPVTALAPELQTTENTATLYDFLAALFAAADEGTSRRTDDTCESASRKFRNWIFKILLSFLSCCTSLLSSETI
jgi:hypothetical protein